MIQTLTFEEYAGRALVRNPRTRRLGSLFVPARRAYVTVMPLILVAASVLCWVAPTDMVLITAACVLTAITLYIVLDLLGRRAPLRVSTVFVMTLGLAYGLGTANTWFTLPRGDLALGDFMHENTADLCLAMSSILCATALLLTVGELYEKPFFGEEFELVFDSRTLVFLTIGTVISALGFVTGKVGFMGSTEVMTGADTGHTNLIASVVGWLTGSALAFTVVATLNVQSRAARLYCGVLSLLLFLMVLPQGRRHQIYAIVLCLLALRLGRYKIPLSPLQKAIGLVLLAGFLYATTICFFYMRLAGASMSHPTLGQRVDGAMQLAKTKSYSEIKQQFSTNIENRTFIIGFLADIEGYARSMPTGHGIDLLKQAEAAIPSAFDPDKDRFYREEAEVNDLFGSHFFDEANSVFTAGALDFGFIGVLVYPLLFTFAIRWFFELLTFSMPPAAACFVIIASCSTLLEPETDITAYFVMLRDAVMYGAFAWIIMSAPVLRLRDVRS